MHSMYVRMSGRVLTEVGKSKLKKSKLKSSSDWSKNRYLRTTPFDFSANAGSSKEVPRNLFYQNQSQRVNMEGVVAVLKRMLRDRREVGA